MTTKLRCILLDDELPGLTYLKMLSEQLAELEIVKIFNSPEKLLREIPSLDFDLCITDIEMPGIDGLALAGKLQGKLVIFTTAYKDFAADAFTIDAVDYITKPVTLERLHKAVLKAVEVYKNKVSDKAITLNTDKGKTVVYCNQLIHVKSAEQDSRDKEALLSDGSILLFKNINFETLLRLLPQSGFLRVNKKEIIGLKHVKHYTHNEITLSQHGKDGKSIRILLSETYRAGFLKRVSI